MFQKVFEYAGPHKKGLYAATALSLIHISIVIKDMSRLGRDYLKVGQVMEILRQRGVRLIAINDGVDLSLIHI